MSGSTKRKSAKDWSDKRPDASQECFHDLRHCCASLLLAQNVHPKVVQEILGHSQISMTLDLYSHVLPAAKSDAADLMGRLLVGNE